VYTWEEYAGNQRKYPSRILRDYTRSPKPYEGLGEDIVRPGRKLLRVYDSLD